MTTGEREAGCALCESDGGEPVWRNARARVVLVEHARFPGFCRVIWNDHVAEQTDLSEADRHWLMEVVTRVERVLRAELAPASATSSRTCTGTSSRATAGTRISPRPSGPPRSASRMPRAWPR